MDTENTLLQISQNEQNLGMCDSDTAGNLINNEDVVDKPITYFMSSPQETNPNGSIKVAKMRDIIESGAYNGTGATLSDARLYSFFKPFETEMRQKEDEYKKIEFDESNFFYRTYKNLPRNWYSLQRNEYAYLLAKAEQAGDEYSASEYRMQIEDLDKQLANYVVPEDDFANSTANLIASIGRNAPELLAISAGGAVVGALTGGAGAIALGAEALSGLVIYNDTYKLESGELLTELQRTHPEMSLDDRISLAESYGNIAALIEASGAFFGITKLGTTALVRGGSKLLAKNVGKEAVKKTVEAATKKEIIKQITKKGLAQKLKDPKFLAYLGRGVFEHVKAAAGEGGQEVTQSLIQNAFIKGIEESGSTSLIDNSIEVLKDGSEASELGKLFLNTFVASLILSGTTAGAASGTKMLFAKSAKGMNIDQISQRIIDNKAKSVAYQKSPKAYSENTQKIVDAGNAPEKISIDSSAWLSVLNKAEEKGETTILQKLNELGLTKEVLEDSIKSTGQMEVDFTKFDDVVLDPNDNALFQMVKGKYTADPTALTLSEFISASQNIDGVAEELRMAESDVSSVYNKVLEGLSQNKNFTSEQAQYNATLAQLKANRMATFEGNEGAGKQVAFDILNVKESMLDKAKGLFQKAFHGGPELEGGKFDLKFAGKKTGQAHGYGVYASAERHTAENYRSRIDSGFTIKGKDITDVFNELLKKNEYDKASVLEDLMMGKDIESLYEGQEVKNWYDKEIKPFLKSEGKLYELDIPEDFKMINEQLRFDDQPEDVRYAILGSLEKINGFGILEKAVEENAYGGEIYNAIGKDVFYDKKGYEGSSTETQQTASQFLSKIGVKGIVYDGGEEGINFVIFNPDDVKIIQKLYQKTTDKHIAGMFSREMGQNIIRLTEAANPTTFLHEFNHLFVTEMIDSFNGGKMTQYWKEQVQKVADFVDAKIVNGKLQLTEAQYEKLANAFTTYLKEGKAPVASLKDVFNRMREWFIDVYRKLRMSNVRLNKSIRSAFDAMLVAQEDLDKAIIDKKLRAIGRRSWVNEHDYQQYISDLSELNRVTTNQHIEAIDKQVKIAREEKNQKMLDDLKVQVAADLGADPKYQLQTEVVHKKIHAADIPASLELNNKERFTDPVGTPIQQFITDHSDIVSNAADVVEILNNIEPLEEATDRIANEKFNEWLKTEYPELAETDSKIAAANEKMLKVRVKEYMMLNKIPMNQFNQVYNELVNIGNKEVAKMSLRQLSNIERLLELETKIVTKSRFAKTDAELSNALWHQAILNHIIMRAKEIRVQLNRFNKHFDKYRYLPTKSQLQKIDAMDFDMIGGVLHNFGFTGKEPRMKDLSIPARLDQWIDSRTQNSFSAAEEVRDYIPFLGRQTETKFDKNTYENFARLDILTRQIEGISQSDYLLKEQGEEILIQDIVNSEISNMVQKGIKPNTREWLLEHVTMKEEYLKNILTEKTFVDRVLPFVGSFAKREQRIQEVSKIVFDALQDTIKRRNEIVQVNLTDGNTLNMTYEDMQFAVIHIDNMEAWIASWNKQRNQNLNEEDFRTIIEQAPQEMLDNAKKIWDVFDAQKYEFRDAVYKTNGYLMKFVEPRQLELSDGRVIQSGYFPSRKMPTAQADFEKVVMAFNNGDAYSNAVSPYARDKNYVAHTELDLGMNSVRSWIYHTATVIEVSPHYNSLSKIINNDSFSSFVGPNVTRILNDWMKYPIVGDQVNKVYSTFDTLSSLGILGFQPMRAIVQALGWIPVMKEIGVQWLAPQLVKRSLSSKQIMQKSAYMKSRYENAINYLGGLNESNMLIRTGKTAVDKLMNYGMWFTAKGDQFSSTAVWNAIYEKSLVEGKTEAEAILLADSMVRTSQSDTSAISRPPILQGNARFITKFASYFIAMNSKINSQFIGQKRLDAVATLALSTIAAPILESIISAMWDWATPTDDDKKKWKKLGIKNLEDLVFYKMKQNIFSTTGMIAMPVAGIGGYYGTALATGMAYDNPLPMLDYIHNIEKAAAYPILAATEKDENAKKRYWRNFKKSGLKALTVPKKWVNMIVE